MSKLPCLCLIALLAAGCSFFSTPPLPAADPVYHTGTTRKIMQLTGDRDRCLKRDTIALTDTYAGMETTDLGSTFEHKGRLYFLFGDAAGSSENGDAIGWTTSTKPSQIPLTFPMKGAQFRPIRIAGIDMGGMCVPSGGISYNNAIYIVQTTQWHDSDGSGPVIGDMERSVMAKSGDDGTSWTYLYDLSLASNHDMANAHFINVSMSIVKSSDWPGLPYSGDNLLIYGTGAYRKSNTYLAVMPANGIETRSNLRYLSGVSGTAPVWSANESNAIALMNQPQAGEMCCLYIPQLRKWVMLYNAALPRGITMRTADQPWGPFSSGKVILDPSPSVDGAYGTYMHSATGWGSVAGQRIDCIYNTDVWGGEYGPYLIPRFTTGDTTSCQLYYALSTWRPHQVIIARSEVGAPVAAPPANSGTQYLMPGDAAWTKTPGNWYTTTTNNGVPWISTLSPDESSSGVMATWLPRDPWNKTLSFRLHGGIGEVLLIEGGGDIPIGDDAQTIYDNLKRGDYGDVIQCAYGNKDTIDSLVTWNLSAFDRANLKIAIIDHSTNTGTSIDVSRMTLTRNTPSATPTPTPSPSPTPTRTPARNEIPSRRWSAYE